MEGSVGNVGQEQSHHQLTFPSRRRGRGRERLSENEREMKEKDIAQRRLTVAGKERDYTRKPEAGKVKTSVTYPFGGSRRDALRTWRCAPIASSRVDGSRRGNNRRHARRWHRRNGCWRATWRPRCSRAFL